MMNAEQLRTTTLHTFGSGAAGFSWFRDICFDDPGKLLALSSAIALAQPYETLMLHGDIMTSADLTLEIEHENLLSGATSTDRRRTPAEAASPWSGRKRDGVMWIVFTRTDDDEEDEIEFAVSSSIMSGGTVACVLEHDGTCARNRWRSPVGSYSTIPSSEGAAAGIESQWEVHSIATAGIVHDSVVVVVKEADAAHDVDVSPPADGVTEQEVNGANPFTK
jgi:hypothetical protein